MTGIDLTVDQDRGRPDRRRAARCRTRSRSPTSAPRTPPECPSRTSCRPGPGSARSTTAGLSHNFTCSHNGAATGWRGGVPRRHPARHARPHPARRTPATITLVVFAPSQPGFYTNQVRVDPANDDPRADRGQQRQHVLDDRGQHRDWRQRLPRVHHRQGPGLARSPARSRSYRAASWSTTWWSPTTAATSRSTSTVEDIIPVGFTFRFAKDTQPGTGDFQCTETRRRSITCTGGTLDGSIGQTARPATTTRTIHVSLFAAGPAGHLHQQGAHRPGQHPPRGQRDQQQRRGRHHGGARRWRDVHRLQDRQQADLAGRRRRQQGGRRPSGALQYTLDGRRTTAPRWPSTSKVQDTLPTGSVFRSAQDVTGPASGKFDLLRVRRGRDLHRRHARRDAGPDETPSPATTADRDRGVRADRARHLLQRGEGRPRPRDPGERRDQQHRHQSTNVRVNGGNNFRDLSVVTASPSAPTDRRPKPGQDYNYEVTVDEHRHQPGVQRRAAQRARRGRRRSSGPRRRTTSRCAHHRQRADLRRRCARRLGRPRPERHRRDHHASRVRAPQRAQLHLRARSAGSTPTTRSPRRTRPTTRGPRT